ncbi:unnamed protein product, partial [Amoebophrya sp. A120]
LRVERCAPGLCAARRKGAPFAWCLLHVLSARAPAPVLGARGIVPRRARPYSLGPPVRAFFCVLWRRRSARAARHRPAVLVWRRAPAGSAAECQSCLSRGSMWLRPGTSHMRPGIFADACARRRPRLRFASI